jgi:hypothetical protein
MISSSFVVRQDGPERRKGRFVVTLSKRVEVLAKGQRSQGDPARIFPGTGARRANALIRHQGGLPTLPPCAAHERLFFFAYDGRFYRCIALTFGWGRSPMWFTHLKVPLVTKLRQSYRVLTYMDDFLSCPAKAGRIASGRDCRRATETIASSCLR